MCRKQGVGGTVGAGGTSKSTSPSHIRLLSPAPTDTSTSNTTGGDDKDSGNNSDRDSNSHTGTVLSYFILRMRILHTTSEGMDMPTFLSIVAILCHIPVDVNSIDAVSNASNTICNHGGTKYSPHV